MTKNQFITRIVGTQVRTFGGNQAPTEGNPLSHALQGQSLSFALGVDVAEVVEIVLRASELWDRIEAVDSTGTPKSRIQERVCDADNPLRMNLTRLQIITDEERVR